MRSSHNATSIKYCKLLVIKKKLLISYLYVYWAITGQYSIINHPITGFVNTSRFTTLIFNLSGYNNDCAEYEITIDPQSFFDQNTGLPNQTCNHLAICVDQFLVEVHFNTLKCCIGICARSERPISTPNS